MLTLESNHWSELHHAYGAATDIPALLSQLSTLPGAQGDSEPWFSLWSALAHQGNVFDASFAAVPHVVHVAATNPLGADAVYFQFPAWVEICRRKQEIEVPGELAGAYLDALAKLPSLVAAASAREWDADFLQCALSAIAAAKGQPLVAEAVQELSPEVAGEFMEWFFER
ncbi:MAG: hypothetical protein V4713_00870 [Pseudomonadota bacterium]